MIVDRTLFTDIHISPVYGDRMANITWESDFVGEVSVYRSMSGSVDGLEYIGSAPAGQPFFVDDKLIPRTKTSYPRYRLIAEEGLPEEETRMSPMLDIYTFLTPLEWAAVRKMRQMEYLRMSRGNGIPVWYLPILSSGTPAAETDGESEQIISVPCAEDMEDGSSGYGISPYAGAYGTPCRTWIEMYDASAQGGVNPEGLGFDELFYSKKTRCLFVPQFKPQGLLIHPATDTRWGIDTVNSPSMFKGMVPVTWDMELTRLSTEDDRYKIPSPGELLTPYQKLKQKLNG